MPALSAKIANSRPLVVLAKTVKGKGCSLMENKANWHYWNPLTGEQVERCRKELA
jgi:transketolase